MDLSNILLEGYSILFESSYPSTNEGSGICIYRIDSNSTKEILLLFRNESDPSVKNTWCIPGGGVEYNEDILKAACREVEEETGITSDKYNINTKDPIYTDQVTPTFKFHTFIAECNEKLVPKLNDEHTKWGWFNKTNIPTPLHAGFSRFLDYTNFLG